MSEADWVPVAGQAVTTLGQASDAVQITVSSLVAVVVLAFIAAWYLRSRHHTGMVPADALISVSTEFSQQINALNQTVEKLHITLSGCHECPYFKLFQKGNQDEDPDSCRAAARCS